jgi:hypothetical protein
MGKAKERSFPSSDAVLQTTEVVLVLLVSCAIAIGVIFTFVWILHTRSLQIQQDRIRTTLKMLDDNWKASLIILLPLFYRTFRRFLARVTKLPGGVEAVTEDESDKAETSAKKNPNPPTAEED